MTFFNDPFVWMAIAYTGLALIFTGRFIGPRPESAPPKSDQKCPHCNTWQSACGGWRWVGIAQNPEIDFSAQCGTCGMFSCWIWVGPGICATYEEIKKQKPTPPGDE